MSKWSALFRVEVMAVGVAAAGIGVSAYPEPWATATRGHVRMTYLVTMPTGNGPVDVGLGRPILSGQRFQIQLDLPGGPLPVHPFVSNSPHNAEPLCAPENYCGNDATFNLPNAGAMTLDDSAGRESIFVVVGVPQGNLNLPPDSDRLSSQELRRLLISTSGGCFASNKQQSKDDRTRVEVRPGHLCNAPWVVEIPIEHSPAE